MSGRPVRTGAALVGAAVIGAAVTLSVSGVAQSEPPPSSPRLSTATVVRTDLVTTTLTAGTLGYGASPPVVDERQGIYTALSTASSTVGAGGVLFRVDDQPVVLMAGTVPAWRTFSAGMADGPDVTELDSNLITLGDARGLFSTADAHFDGLTAEAVSRWQQSLGIAGDGTIPLGEVAFLPGPVRIGAAQVALGQEATPGQEPFAVTTTSRVVSVPLSAASPTVTVGEPVSVVLPTTTSVPATVTTIISPPPSSGQSQAAAEGGGSGQLPASAIAVVTPADPGATGTADGVAVQVSLTTEDARGVLAAPISSLLALSEGGYALEVVGPGGRHHLVGVTTGVFTASQVQVTGTGIDAGVKVVTAQ